MQENGASGIARLLAAALLVGWGVGSLQSCAETGTVAAARDAPGTRPGLHSGRIDQVRLGFGLNPEGRVSPGCAASSFALHDPIHLSMQITDAPAGSVVRASVRDVVTQDVAWSEDKPVPSGGSYVTFEIGRELAAGRYRAESTLGDGGTTPQEFVVHVRNGSTEDPGRVRPHG